MKEMDVTFTWRSTHRITVPDDFEVPATLDGFPDGVLDEIDSANAELVDWA